MSNLIFFCIFVGLILFIILNNIFKKVYRFLLFGRYEELFTIMSYAQDIAYKKIYQDEVIIQSVNGKRITNKELENLKNQFFKHVLLLCGPKVVEDFEILYGDLDAFCALLCTNFVSRLKDDEAEFLTKVTESEEYME